MTLSSTSSGRYRAGLHGERSVQKPMESPLNSRNPGGPLGAQSRLPEAVGHCSARSGQ